jgi:hypothetical protein
MQTSSRQTLRFVALVAAACSALGIAQGCGSSDSPACRVGADCASGVCGSNGQCVSPTGADAATQQDGSSVADAGADAPLLTDGGNTSKDGSAGCAAARDGIITLSDLPLAAGQKANFRAASSVDVDTAGVKNADGTRTWDLSGALAGDRAVITELVSPAGTWYAADFAQASYVTRLSESSDLLGVFKLDSQALVLLGVVSPGDGLTRTNVSYNPSAAILPFPIALDKAWTSDTQVSGLANGILSAYSEKYESKADAKGDIKTPLGTFQVLRINTLLTRTVGLLTTKVRTFAFVAECYGTVARMRSRDNETEVEFTRAAEVDRMAP